MHSEASAMVDRRVRVLCTALQVVWLALLSERSHAQSKPATKAESSTSVPALGTGMAQRLRSGDPAQLNDALGEIRVAGKAGAHLAPEIAALLDRGVPPAVAVNALDTLGDLEVDATS